MGINKSYLKDKFLSTKGYKRNSPDVNNPYNVIPSNQITMKGVDFPIMGIDNTGHQKMMYPGQDYTFPGNYVTEFPLKNMGNKRFGQKGIYKPDFRSKSQIANTQGGQREYTNVPVQRTPTEAKAIREKQLAELKRKTEGTIRATTDADKEAQNRQALTFAGNAEKRGASSPLNDVLDFVNPFSYYYAGKDALRGVGQTAEGIYNLNPNQISSGLTQAGLGVLGAIPAVGELKPALKGASKVFSKKLPFTKYLPKNINMGRYDHDLDVNPNLSWRSDELVSGTKGLRPYNSKTGTYLQDDYIDNIKNWYESSEFKRIMKEEYPNVDIEKYKQSTLENLQKPITYNLEKQIPNSAGVYYPKNSNDAVFIGRPNFSQRVRVANQNKQIPEGEGQSYLKHFSATDHELSHQRTNSRELLPDYLTQEYLWKNTRPSIQEKPMSEVMSQFGDYKYYSDPTEFEVRMRQLREDLKREGIVDYFKEPIQQKHIEELATKYSGLTTEYGDIMRQQHKLKKYNPETKSFEVSPENKEKYFELEDKLMELENAGKVSQANMSKDTKDLLDRWNMKFLAENARRLPGVLPYALPIGGGLGAGYIMQKQKPKGTYQLGGTNPQRYQQDNTSVTSKINPVSKRLINEYNAEKLKSQQPAFNQGYQKTASDIERSDYYRKQKELRDKLKNVDVVTDIMQVGNFIPHPIAQAIGTVGNLLGAATDVTQAGMDFGDENYGNMVMNLGSAALSGYLGSKGRGYTRDMFNTVPGSMADKIASFGSRSGNYRPLTALPNLKNNPVIQRGLNYNRAILGGLGVETLYDAGTFDNKTRLGLPIKPIYQGGGTMSMPGVNGQVVSSGPQPLSSVKKTRGPISKDTKGNVKTMSNKQVKKILKNTK